MATTLGSRSMGSFGSGGSGSNTSRAAPARRLPDSAAKSAARSTRLPRATLTSTAEGFMRASSSAPRSALPLPTAVECRVTTSELASSSSSGTRGTPISRAFSAGRYGSWPSSRASNARAREATRDPTWPRPTMPTVLPASSAPTNFDFSHLPDAMDAAASGMRRSSAKSTANVCSTAETTLPVGEFRTSTPRAEAAGTSTLSTPTPARPTTASFGAAAKSSASTLVALRTSSASASFRATSSSARGTPARSITSCPAWRSRSSPAEETFSATTTRLTTPPSRSRRARRGAPRARPCPRRPCARSGRSTPSTCRSRRRS